MKRSFYLLAIVLCLHFKLFAQTPDPIQQWAFAADRMNVPAAWAEGAAGQNIKIAVIDGGVDLNHPDLKPNLLEGYDATKNYTGIDTKGGIGNLDVTHGTSCAGIVGATDNGTGMVGVAPYAKIIPIKARDVMNPQGTGLISYNEDWTADAIIHAVDMGADVISCSWGVTLESSKIYAAFQYAWMKGRNGKGCVIVFAAGNEHDPNIHWAGTLPGTLTVGASTQDDQLRADSKYGTYLDVVAPGSEIWTTDNAGSAGTAPGDYDVFSKTSAACPNAAGVIALMLSAKPNLTYDKAIQLIISSADQVNGIKRVNALKAVRAARQSTGPYVSAVSATDYVYTHSNPVQFYVEPVPSYLNYSYRWTITADQSCGSSYNGPRFYSNGNGTTATTSTNKINVNTGTCDGTFWIRCEAVSSYGVRLYSPRLFKVRKSSGGSCNYSLNTYPNPSNNRGDVTINLVLPPPGCETSLASGLQSESSRQIEHIEVFDHFGNLVRKEATHDGLSHGLDTRNLNPGIYYLNVYTDHGKVIRQKLLVE